MKEKGNLTKSEEKGIPGKIVGFVPRLLSYKILNQSGGILQTKHIEICKTDEPIPLGCTEELDIDLELKQSHSLPEGTLITTLSNDQ